MCDSYLKELTEKHEPLLTVPQAVVSLTSFEDLTCHDLSQIMWAVVSVVCYKT